MKDLKENSKGLLWYGIHFYPGVAEYKDGPDQEPYRVFLNEDTLRSMDPSFAVKPVFVEHVDEVEEDLNELRKVADGWVVESFYNQADGKHWVKFITVTDRAERAIKNGLRLSNAYVPISYAQGGLWNGVSYVKEITSGQYDHLAIVKDPRYEESIILTPDEFKKYNEDKKIELAKLANSKHPRGEIMKLSFFKKQKLENALDLESTSVILPKSKREITLECLVNEMDEKEMKKDDDMANMDHKVKMDDGSMMKVSEMMSAHKAMKDELEAMKKKEDGMVEEEDVKAEKEPVDSESSDKHSNDEDEEAKKKALQLAEHEEKEIEAAKKKNALEKANRLKNAHLKAFEEPAPVLELMEDQVRRGKTRYGS